jgi:hypothetical protein
MDNRRTIDKITVLRILSFGDELVVNSQNPESQIRESRKSLIS